MQNLAERFKRFINVEKAVSEESVVWGSLQGLPTEESVPGTLMVCILPDRTLETRNGSKTIKGKETFIFKRQIR
jgi:hypothetical protein